VALGDSWTGNICGGKSYVDYYADYIESDLGVKVRVLNEQINDLYMDELLSNLRTKQQLRNEISEAKVVTFLIGGGDAEGIVLNPGVTDIRKALAPWRETYDAVIDEIVSLRSPSDTIIRAIEYPNPWVSYLKKQGILDQVYPNCAAWVEQIVEAASEHNIPVARVYLAWNGPNGDEDPVAKGYTCGDVSKLKSVVHPQRSGKPRHCRGPSQTGIQTLRPIILPLSENVSLSPSLLLLDIAQLSVFMCGFLGAHQHNGSNYEARTMITDDDERVNGRTPHSTTSFSSEKERRRTHLALSSILVCTLFRSKLRAGLFGQ
jgi:hypothetical protein